MYDFKYIEGFDPSIIEYSNPVKAGSIEMPIIKYQQPFSQRKKYPIFVNPEKTGSISFESIYDKLILKDSNIKRVKPKTYEKLREHTPLSVNLSSFTAKVPTEIIQKQKQKQEKKLKQKQKQEKKLKQKQEKKLKLADSFDEEFKKKIKLRTKKSESEIIKEILDTYKPISIYTNTNYSQKQINDSYDIRKKIITDFAKKVNIRAKGLYFSGFRDEIYSQHAETDSKDIDQYFGEEPFVNMDKDIIEGQANIFINPVIPSKKALNDPNFDMKKWKLGEYPKEYYELVFKNIREKSINVADIQQLSAKILNELNAKGIVEHTCNLKPVKNSQACIKKGGKCSDASPQWCDLKKNKLIAYNPLKSSHNQSFLNDKSSCKVQCKSGYSTNENTVCRHGYDKAPWLPILTSAKCYPNCITTIEEHAKQNDIDNWEKLTVGEDKIKSYKENKKNKEFTTGNCPVGGLGLTSSCTPECADGYENIGNKVSTCQKIKDKPVLKPAICMPKKCILPTSINNGDVQNCKGTNSGDVCLPKCNSGYMAIPSTCVRGTWKNESKGKWINMIPMCVPIKCKKPVGSIPLYNNATICISNDKGVICKNDIIDLKDKKFVDGIYYHPAQTKIIGNCFTKTDKIDGSVATIDNCIGNNYHWDTDTCYVHTPKNSSGVTYNSNSCKSSTMKWYSKGISKNVIQCDKDAQLLRQKGRKIRPQIICNAQSYNVKNFDFQKKTYDIEYNVLGCKPRICDSNITQQGRSIGNKAYPAYTENTPSEEIYNEWKANANKRKINTDITFKCKDGHKTLFTDSSNQNKGDRRKYVCSLDHATGAKYKPWIKEKASCHPKACSSKVDTNTTDKLSGDSCIVDGLSKHKEVDYIEHSKKCNFKCKNGYELLNPKSPKVITCNLGVWTDGTKQIRADHDEPEKVVDFGCTEKNCDLHKLQPPKNGTKYKCGNTLKHDQTCKMRCDNGYTFPASGGVQANVENIVTCDKGNVIMSHTNRCAKAACGRINITRNEGGKDIASFKCPQGGVALTEATCKPTCNDKNNYSINGTNDEITYKCKGIAPGLDSGRLVAQSKWILQSDKKDTKSITCRRKSCFSPKRIANTQKLVDGDANKEQKKGTNKIMKISYEDGTNNTLTTTCSGIGACYYQCAAGYQVDVENGSREFVDGNNNKKDDVGVITCGGAQEFSKGGCIPRACDVSKDINLIKHNNSTSGRFLKKKCSGSFVNNNLTLIKHDSKCNFSCENGYRLSGAVKGKYTTTYKCDVKNESPTKAVNKMVVIPNTVALQCIPFFCPKPDNTTGYLYDNKKDLPEKISLKKIDSVSKVKVITDLELKLKCNSKYILKPNSQKPTATCEKSQTDNKKYVLDGCVEGKCNDKMTQPANTNDINFDKKIDEDVKFTCKKGFSTDGKFKRYKKEEKLLDKFEKKAPAKCIKKKDSELGWKSSTQCKEKQCEAPKDNSTWKIEGTSGGACSFKPNKSCTFQCTDGHQYVDSWNNNKNPLLCNEGEWRAKGTNNIIIPKDNCTPKECRIKYSEFKNYFKNGDEGNCKKEGGNNFSEQYLLIGHNKVCTPKCKSGYELSGGDKKTGQPTYKCNFGKLTEEKLSKKLKLQCVPIICPKPDNTTGYLYDNKKDLPNKISLISTSGAKLYKAVKVKCSGTYLRKDKDKAPTFECKVNNQTYKLDGCVEGKCNDKMTQPANTNDIDFDKKIDEDVKFTCKKGFSTDGKFKRYKDNKTNLGNEKFTTAKCTKTGVADVEWESSTQCKENRCEKPKDDSIWSMKAPNNDACSYNIGSSCVSSCKPGYRFVKSWESAKLKPLICIHGEWRENNSKKSDIYLNRKIVRPEQKCEPLPCTLSDDINKITNGGFTKCSGDFESTGKLKHGTTCGVTCNPGFQLENNNNRNYKCSVQGSKNIMLPTASAANCVPVSCSTLKKERNEGGEKIDPYQCKNTKKGSTCSPTCKDKKNYSIDGINGSVTYKCVGVSEGKSEWQIQGDIKDTKSITCKRTSCFYFKDKKRGGKHINFTRKYGKEKDGLKVKTYTKSDNNTLKTILSGWGDFDYQCAPGYYLSSKSKRKFNDKDDIGVVICGQGKGVFSDAECIPRPCKINDSLNKPINVKIKDGKLFNIDHCTDIYNNKNKQINYDGTCLVSCKFGTLLNKNNNTKYKCSVNERGENIMIKEDANKGDAQCNEITCDLPPKNVTAYNSQSLPKKGSKLTQRNPSKKDELYEHPVKCSDNYVREDLKSKRPRAICNIKGDEKDKRYSLLGCSPGKCKKGVIKEPINVNMGSWKESTLGGQIDFPCKKGYSTDGKYNNNSSTTKQTCSKIISTNSDGTEKLLVPQKTEWKSSQQCQENKCRPRSSTAIGSVPEDCKSNPKDECKIECKKGYKHIEGWGVNNQLYCKEGIWRDKDYHDRVIEDPKIKCELNSCDLNDNDNKKVIIPNGKFVCEGNQYTNKEKTKLKGGGTCKVECDDGYRLINEDSVYTCNINESDKNTLVPPKDKLPTCKKINCRKLIAISYEYSETEKERVKWQYTCNKRGIGEKCEFSCSSDYKINGINAKNTYICTALHILGGGKNKDKDEEIVQWKLDGKLVPKNPILECRLGKCFAGGNKYMLKIENTIDLKDDTEQKKVKTMKRIYSNGLTECDGTGKCYFQCAPEYKLDEDSKKFNNKDDVGIITCDGSTNGFTPGKCVPRPCNVSTSVVKNSIYEKCQGKENNFISHGKTCDIDCSSNYFISGNKKYICDKGTMKAVGTPVKCTPLVCNQKPTSTKGYINLPDKVKITHKDGINVDCAPKYLLSSQPKAICNNDHPRYTLSGCSLGKCSSNHPENINKIYTPNKEINDTQVFTCEDKYSVDGKKNSKNINTTQKCIRDDDSKGISWQPVKRGEKCIENGCYFPTIKDNWSWINCSRGDMDHGQKCKFRCNDGYKYASDWNKYKKLICNNEEWEYNNNVMDPNSKCSKKPCNLIDTDNKNIKVSNGKIICKDDQYLNRGNNILKANGECSVECNPGYKLQNEGKLTCDVKNKKNVLVFPKDIPQCVRVDCRKLKVSINTGGKKTDYTCPNNQITKGKNTCEIKCGHGFSVKPYQNSNSLIDKMTYTCSALKGGKSNDKDHKISQWKEGDSMVDKNPSIECKQGSCFTIKGVGGISIQNTVKLEDNEYKKQQTSGNNVLRLPKNNPNPSDGITKCSGKGKCYFQCAKNYIPHVDGKKYTGKEKLSDGAGVVSCSKASYQKGECLLSKCDLSNTLSNLTNGSKGTCGNTLKHGDTCNPSCNTGYTYKDGKNKFECDKGVLKGIVKCIPITCSKPSSGTEMYKYNGQAMPNTLQRKDYNYPTDEKNEGIKLTCSTNYRISSQPLAKCEKTGNYSQSGCVLAKCVSGNPKQPDNTQTVKYDKKLNETQVFTCKQGHSKDKDGKVTKITKKCDKGSVKIPQKMVWKDIKSNVSEECFPNKCDNPSNSDKWRWKSGCKDQNNLKLCSFECKPGYDLKGETNTTLKCNIAKRPGLGWTQDGKVFDPNTKCEPSNCSETFSLNNGAKGKCNIIEGKVTLNHNSSCTPTCNSKYELSGGDNKQYKCNLGDLTEKKMSKKLQCVPIVCPKPKNIGEYQNVPNSVSQVTDLGKENVTCKGIRVTKGTQPLATCSGSSSKPYTLSGCKAGKCLYKNLSKPSHGSNNAYAKKREDNETGNIDETFTFTCDKGYETILKNGNKRNSTSYSCFKKGTDSTEWKKDSNEVNSCVGKSCKIKKSDLPTNIDTNKSACKENQVLNNDKTCKFTCATGYKLEPGKDNTLTCNAENITAQGKCVEQECIKDVMKDGLKGNCTFKDEKIYIESGKSCSPKCINGYKIANNNTQDNINCSRGKSNDLKCEKVTCPVLTVTKRGPSKQYCKNVKTGDTCKVPCPSGFTINGTGAVDKTYKCNGTGYGTSQWDIGRTTDDLQCKRTSCFRKGSSGGITISNTDALQGDVDKLQAAIKNVSHKYTNNTTTTCSGNGNCYFQCKTGFSAYVDNKITNYKDSNRNVVKSVGLVTCGGDKDGFGKAECKENQCTLTKIANGGFTQGGCKGTSSVAHNTECDLTCKDDEYISNEADSKKEINNVKYKCDKGTMKPTSVKDKHICRAILCTPPSTVGYNVNNIDNTIKVITSANIKKQIEQCTTGFQGKGNIQPCSKHKQPYMLSGCNHNTCAKPSSTQGYKLVAKMSLLEKDVEDVKYKPSCDTNYYSNEKDGKGIITKCNAHNKPYLLSGCNLGCKKSDLINTVKDNKLLNSKTQILGENILHQSNVVNDLQKKNSIASFQCKTGYGVNIITKSNVPKEEIGEAYKCGDGGKWENTKKCEKRCNEKMIVNKSETYRGCQNKSLNEQCQHWNCKWTKPTKQVGECITKEDGTYGVCKIDESKCKSPNKVINSECIAIKKECDKINGTFIPNAMLDKNNCKSSNTWKENKLVNIDANGEKSCIHWPGANTPNNLPGRGLDEIRTEMGYIIKENHNYCRNPNNQKDGVWCFTRDRHVRYGNCKEPVKTNSLPSVPISSVSLNSMLKKLTGSRILKLQ